jgi:anti-sigma factor ChrR (cupin superfamily)
MADPLALPDLINGGWRERVFEPFAEGIEICRLVAGEPAIGLLRYAPGARVARHRHTGLETVLVLDGSQSDERGRYSAGTLVLNPAGYEHSVWSEDGCVVLVQWSRPVAFVDPA